MDQIYGPQPILADPANEPIEIDIGVSDIEVESAAAIESGLPGRQGCRRKREQPGLEILIVVEKHVEQSFGMLHRKNAWNAAILDERLRSLPEIFQIGIADPIYPRRQPARPASPNKAAHIKYEFAFQHA
ncbi:hypothetical protein [Sphingomonas sp. 66-10]|uniref:hypothetical protein n=1 Tax=Sphingomonas sp. 66-10 TaxID=1895848 RepID=UPI00257ABAC7|nr:hypothetical protein [Sphingomonas sp. 66-10]